MKVNDFIKTINEWLLQLVPIFRVTWITTVILGIAMVVIAIL